MKKLWKLVRLGDVLQVINTAEPASKLSSVNLAGIFSFGRGLFKRGPMSPADTSYKTYNRLVTDDFVISQPKAWEGAMARVTGEFEGWYLSPVFPTFRAKREFLDTAFLEWYCKQAAVWAELQRDSRGMGARRETVSPEQFLSLKIPLPSIDEQRRVAGRIEKLAGQINEAHALRELASEEAKALGATVSEKRLSGIGRSESLGKLIAEGTTISYGVLVPGPEVEDGVPFVRIQDLAVKDPPPRPSKRISPAIKKAYARTRLKGGEVLLAVVGATIGKVGVAPDIWRGANIARAVCRIIPGPMLDREFLVHVLQSQQTRAYFKSVTRTLAQPTLNVGQLELTQIPLPPLAEQRRIVAELDALQTQVDALKRLQAETAAELDALLPSILDKAFRGEL